MLSFTAVNTDAVLRSDGGAKVGQSMEMPHRRPFEYEDFFLFILVAKKTSLARCRNFSITQDLIELEV